MGHLIGKDVYRKLGSKLDGLTMRTPWNETFYTILKELYSPEEADVIVKMPYGLAGFRRIQKATGYEEKKLHKILDGLCSKGLVFDLWINDKYRYMPSPMVIGIFELTMMRTGGSLNSKEWARLFYDYMQGDDAFFRANSGRDEKVSILRTLPYEEAVKESQHVEILDYEKAAAIVESADRFAIGICSCRHEKVHLDKKKCKVPLETCSSFGAPADYLIRHDLGREVSKSEMLENLARSMEMGLVFNADNVQKNVSFMCHCCDCCCNVLLGIRKFGYPNIVVTSTFIAVTDDDACTGCGKCAKVCPVDAIEMVPLEKPAGRKKKIPKIDARFCIGCGVCALSCRPKARKLEKRRQRVLHPETTFERVILQCLEKGTLQNQLFDDSQSITHKFMRGFLGAFLRLSPVQKALMSDMLRSSFLNAMKSGIKSRGRGWVSEL